MNFTFTWIMDKFGFQPKVEIAPAKKVAVKKPAAKKTAKKTTAKKTAKKKVS